MQHMPIPEQNDPRATSALFPGAAFRDRGTSSGVLILRREVSRGHDALHTIFSLRVRDPSLYMPK